ncbi:hypothetical protein HQN89_04845 [Paenibacillus frigoriresistens]|nr:hypothetical protein [Paenibacillus frigoriresistens]NRF90362.1 hypothetical protein [Paenibacillus frigoriresistens]
MFLSPFIYRSSTTTLQPERFDSADASLINCSLDNQFQVHIRWCRDDNRIDCRIVQ